MIVLGVLLQGLIQGQPTPEPQQPETSPRPVAAPPLLRPDLEKTPLSYFSDYWKQLGERARQRLVLVDRNATPGLVVARDLVVAPLRVADTLGDEVARRAVLGGDPAERDLAPRLAGVDPTLGIALLAVPEATAPVFTLREAPLAAGQLVAAVSIRPDGAAVIAPGHVMVSGPAPGSPNLLVSLELPRGFGSAAVVDLDGRLAGVALEDGAGLRVHAAPALIRAVQRLQHDPFCSAVQVGALDAAVRGLLGTERGVLVESVVAAAFVPGPSLRTGDVLLDWGGEPVSDPATFQQAYRASPPGELVRYRIIRNGAVLRGATRMPASDCRPVVEQPVVLQQTGLALRQLHGAGGLEGLRVLAVRADASAAAAGLQEGDVVVSVGPGAGSASAALRTLESYEKRPRPLLLRVQRDGVLRLVALGAGS